MTKPNTISAVRKYTTKDGEEKSQWTQIGVAWPKKGGFFKLELDFVPTNLAEVDLMISPPYDGNKG